MTTNHALDGFCLLQLVSTTAVQSLKPVHIRTSAISVHAIDQMINSAAALGHKVPTYYSGRIERGFLFVQVTLLEALRDYQPQLIQQATHGEQLISPAASRLTTQCK